MDVIDILQVSLEIVQILQFSYELTRDLKKFEDFTFELSQKKAPFYKIPLYNTDQFIFSLDSLCKINTHSPPKPGETHLHF